MKRALMALACATTAALLAPAVSAPAQAHTSAQVSVQAKAPAADPVTALRKQYAAGHGVRYVSSGAVTIAGIQGIKFSAHGGYAFNRSGIAATESVQKAKWNDLLKDEIDDLEGADDPVHKIVIGTTGYYSGGVYASVLPEGKTWLRLPGERPASTLSLLVNPVDARALKTVLATTKAKRPGGKVNGVKTTLYRGTITLGQLIQADPSVKEGFAGLGTNPGKTVVSWKLWIGPDQLVRRASAGTDLKLKIDGDSFTVTLSEDTRFAGWGKKVTVKAPPKSKIANVTDIDSEVPDTPGIIDIAK
ncbi:hypothetical protein GCM10010116_13670 [Microbispora rosea subsp. aerata]|nr:hypothetical protein [Microbispora rosea]GGO06865.1 hypothetical protein GCM10010116_13670 [Microbispora rosea subsp. aerata]GIH55026.1 hypothetical protein Mro02_19400 [Microbispora rosea subsp. aerata]GLJ82475.1 hypothetical protein GCM10017588_12000 [Microbispora rosea subsp. aerata]